MAAAGVAHLAFSGSFSQEAVNSIRKQPQNGFSFALNRNKDGIFTGRWGALWSLHNCLTALLSPSLRKTFNLKWNNYRFRLKPQNGWHSSLVWLWIPQQTVDECGTKPASIDCFLDVQTRPLRENNLWSVTNLLQFVCDCMTVLCSVSTLCNVRLPLKTPEFILLPKRMILLQKCKHFLRVLTNSAPPPVHQ